MTTNQEGRQAAIRDSTSSAYGVAADWHALFDDAGISAGTFNERLLAWINDQLGTSYSNLLGAMAAYAADAGFNAWSSISTLVLGGASTLLSGETDGLAFDFTDSSARIKDTSTPANEYSSTGIVSSGSLVGPSGKLTYTSVSNKLTLQSDGVMRYQAHNLAEYSNNFEGNSVNGLTNATVSGNVVSISGANAYLYRTLSTSMVSGASYQIDCDVTCSTTAVVGLRVATGTERAELAVSCTAGVTQSVTLTFTMDATGIQFGVEQRPGVTSGVSDLTGETVTIENLHLRRTPSNDDYIETAGAAKYALPLEYDTSGDCLGLLVEEQRTNLCLYSNDLTQAGSWTASNMTTAKTATGPDGVANSATTITATAGNATVLQAITSTSAARVTSVFIKRRTGTGNIDLTQDNGSTWTTQAVDSTWTRFSLSSVTSANPTVGIRIVTSGDAVDVALFSHEVGAFVTSPILTYGAAATRAADNISIATSAFPHSDSTQSVFVQVITQNATTQSGGVPFFEFHDGTTSNLYRLDRYTGGAACRVTTGGGSQTNAIINGFGTNASIQAGGNPFKGAMSIATDDVSYVGNGGTVTTDTAASLPTVTSLKLGAGFVQPPFCGTIQRISVVPRTKSDAELQAETA